MATAFRFRLSTVLRVRRLTLQTHQRAVAARLAAIRDLQQRGDRLRRAIDEQTTAARASLGVGGPGSEPVPLAVEQVIWDRQYLARLRRELHESLASQDQHRSALVLERRALAEALKGVRSLERLEERQSEVWRREMDRLERREEDERAVQRSRFAGVTGDLRI